MSSSSRNRSRSRRNNRSSRSKSQSRRRNTSRRSRNNRSRNNRSRSRSRNNRNNRNNRSRSRSRSPARGWTALAPRSTNPRRNLKSKCGSKCFLSPRDLKYPICSKNTKSCKPDCRGLLAAKIRSSQSGRAPSIARKADSIGRRMKCSWSRD
jgi:hypothetical protein